MTTAVTVIKYVRYSWKKVPLKRTKRQENNQIRIKHVSNKITDHRPIKSTVWSFCVAPTRTHSDNLNCLYVRVHYLPLIPQIHSNY